MPVVRAEAGPLPDLPSVFTTAAQTLDVAARDFGGLADSRPLAVARPETIDEVALAIHHARAARLTIAPRGQGHCTRGQALAPGGVVLDLRQLRTIEVGDGCVTAGAGARWDEVVRRRSSEGSPRRFSPTISDSASEARCPWVAWGDNRSATACKRTRSTL